MLKLIELNDDNYDELSRLEIRADQKAFVKDFRGCIEYKNENPFLKIYGIYDAEINKFVGLTAVARWDDQALPIENRWCWLDELFIDIKYQHLGYGKRAIPLILSLMKEMYKPKFIVLSVCNDNPAKHLYEELGFIKTDLIYDEASDSILRPDIIKCHDEILMYKLV